MATPNSSITVNNATSPGKKLATYEFGSPPVESEAVTLTDGMGNELLGQQAASDSVPVVLASDQSPIEIALGTSTLQLGAETAVSSSAVEILAANPDRAWCLVQNTGSANIRVGPAGVGTTTGLRLVTNGVATYDQLGAYQGALFAIAETSAPSVAFAQESTTP
jgi:hypothetical protein